MRIYLPATAGTLAALERDRRVPLSGPAFAVTPALREWYAEGDLEELEYAALTAAARESLRLLAAAPRAPRRRAVLAADLPDRAVAPAPHLHRAAVTVSGEVTIGDVASAHVDDADAEPAVAAAAAALEAAESGDDDAAFVVDEVEGYELSWWATQELPDLLASLGD